MALIECRNVSKRFRRHTGQKLMRHYFEMLLHNSRRSDSDFYALRDVSFSVQRGESLGVVGRNGAGKSTLLSLVSGLAPPDSGSVEVHGRVAALLQLGAGFHPDLTGAENLLLNAALLGFTEEQARARFSSIVDFAEIGDFIEERLGTWSSGMIMRLAFSIAVNVDPDVLIVDEVLAVGDHSFQTKCFERIRQLRDAGTTFLCVSHSRAMLLEFCDQGLWLDHGTVVMQGDIQSVVDAYDGHAAAV